MTERGGRGLTRRQLVGGAAAIAGGGALARSTEASPAGAAPAEAPHPGSAPFELAGLGVRELAAGLASGRWTSKRLVELYLERIDRVDRGGRGTNAIAEVNPDALAIAEKLDAERKRGRILGPLHGIPIVVKDNVDTADRMRTTAGSLALAESIPAKDAHMVGRLRRAGAVLLAKTNLSEWANIRSTRSTSGWSGRGGQVRNPHALDRNPCGSSSGSGVAAAAELAAVAVGTETDGSVTCPASMNGVVGLKPTLGLVSRSGIVPIAHSQDTAGPMGRSVEDVALLLEGMVGVDLTDPATAASADRIGGGFAASLAPDALSGARLGVARNLFGWHPEIDRQMAGVLATLARLGATLVDPAEVPKLGEYDATELEVLLYELKHDLNAYLGGLPAGDHPKSLAQVIEFNRAHADREMPWFGQELFEQAQEKGPLSEETYRKALDANRRLSRAEGLDAVLAEHRLDALVCPTMGPAYPTDWVLGDHYTGSATSPSAVSGYPHLTVPAGFVHGLPWGLSFLGPAWSDARLLALGHAFELASRARRAPAYLPTLALGG